MSIFDDRTIVTTTISVKTYKKLKQCRIVNRGGSGYPGNVYDTILNYISDTQTSSTEGNIIKIIGIKFN